MDVGETLRRHVNALNRWAHVSGHLGSLAVQAARSPGTDDLVHAWPQKPERQQTVGAPNTRLRKDMKCIKCLAAELLRKKWAIHACRIGAEEYVTAGEESVDHTLLEFSGRCQPGCFCATFRTITHLFFSSKTSFLCHSLARK